MSRRANGEGTIRKCADRAGYEGQMSQGRDPITGRTLPRKKFRGKTRAEVSKAMHQWRVDREAGHVPAVTSGTTVDEYLAGWFNVHAATVRPNTASAYRTNLLYVTRSGIGATKLSQLRPEHIERLYRWIIDGGRKVSTAANAQRTLRIAFNDAVERGYLVRNPVKLAKLPKGEGAEDQLNPYDRNEIAKLITTARQRRNGIRWELALLGLRRGEVLGLTWDRVDFDEGRLLVDRQIIWRDWQHGCAKDSLGAPTCRSRGTDKKPQGQPQKAGYCPGRQGGGWRLEATKSKAGKRTIGIPAPLLPQLRRHRAAQLKECVLVGSRWNDHGFVIAGKRGGPVDNTTDHREWNQLIEASGVRRERAHGMRHTAATQLLLLGEDSRNLLGVFGWSDMRLVQRYAHYVDEVAAQVSSRQAVLWSGLA